jgi:predicted transcriptional regulator
MSQKYRNRIDIIAHLLNAAHTGATTKTKIMRKAMISYGQLGNYLQMMTENGLIAYDNVNRRFMITEKGYQFMEMYEDLSKLIGSMATIVTVEEIDYAELPRM